MSHIRLAFRSESKSGLDKSDRKGGAGAHNWGSYADEQDHEFRAAFEDYEDVDEEGGGLSADLDGTLERRVAVVWLFVRVRDC